MVDLTNNLARTGAIDALNALLQAKMRPLRKTNGFESPEEMDNKASAQDPNKPDNQEPNRAEDSKSKNSNSQNQQNKANPNRQEDDEEYNKYGMKMPKNETPVEDDVEEDPNDPDYESPEEHQRRLDRVEAELNDDELNKQTLDQIQQHVKAEKDKIARAKADEMRKLAAETAVQNTWLNLSDLTSDIVKTIGTQIKIRNKPEDSYLRPNATFAGTKFILPGQKNLEHRDLPVINIYFDKSGSVPRSGLERAREAMKELYNLEKRKLVKYRIYYFASEIVDEDSKPCGSGTTAFPKILDHLQATRATNAIIITDDDFETQTTFSTISPINLKGKVWWLWHNGERSPSAFRYIQARLGRAQFSFS